MLSKAERAAKLSRIPGVTIAQAAKRYGVTPAEVRRARATVTGLDLSDYALAALTGDGKRRKGVLGDLTAIAGYIDYINHDACTAAEARALLQECVEEGVLAIEGDRWRLTKAWP
ncbi:MAG: hypothetical protein ACXWLM_06610 [Myxococcales bacterium]